MFWNGIIPKKGTWSFAERSALQAEQIIVTLVHPWLPAEGLVNKFVGK